MKHLGNMRIERHLVRNAVIECDVHDRDMQRFVARMGDRQAIAAASFTESAAGYFGQRMLPHCR